MNVLKKGGVPLIIFLAFQKHSKSSNHDQAATIQEMDPYNWAAYESPNPREVILGCC